MGKPWGSAGIGGGDPADSFRRIAEPLQRYSSHHRSQTAIALIFGMT